ncbi:MAG: hypothetical protein GEU98_19930 [Pseudonocardiaceae bacterium]|nr:hypothetical protein [Pseudonocardiaceae bacterium]
MILWQLNDSSRHGYDAPAPIIGDQVRALCGVSLVITREGLTEDAWEGRPPLCVDCATAYVERHAMATQP